MSLPVLAGYPRRDPDAEADVVAASHQAEGRSIIPATHVSSLERSCLGQLMTDAHMSRHSLELHPAAALFWIRNASRRLRLLTSL
jgi:hypothetical protein